MQGLFDGLLLCERSFHFIITYLYILRFLLLLNIYYMNGAVWDNYYIISYITLSIFFF